MVEAFVEFNQLLLSRKFTLTTEESKLINTWKTSAQRKFGIGVAGASVATWLVTQRQHKLFRVSLAVGVGFVYGRQRLHKCIDSGVELILSQHGTRLQKELGEIMLKKYQHNPPLLRHFSKYFYHENVYDDDSTDQPKPRWRFRSTYGDIICSHRIDGDGDDSSSKKTHLENTDLRKTNLERRQINMNGGGAAAAPPESTEDPFDCILGHQVSVEEIRHADAPSAPPRWRNQSHKRSHRRRRKHHQENMDD